MSLRIFWFFVCSLEAVVCAADSTAFSPTVAADPDFIIRSHRKGPSAADVLKRCQRLREEIQRVWVGAAEQDDWRPRCEIVLHATRASYLPAVGRNGTQTSGSSFVCFEEGRIITRRIDLLVDRQGHVEALPHELTHVVLADHFGGQRPPRWLDEGIATMADSVEKQTLHRRDCQHALRTRTALRMLELLTLEEFTSPRQVPSFYGQSVSLVRFLVERDEPEQVVVFARVAMEKGYDYALQQLYGLDSVVALERKWRDYAITARNRQMLMPVITIRQRP